MADFKAIETFMWVVTLGSFRGAAQKLHTTQPAISQRIAQLEREVGVRLLQRDRRMVLPTPSGRQMMVYAEKLIGLRSEMLAVVGDRTPTAPGAGIGFALHQFNPVRLGFIRATAAAHFARDEKSLTPFKGLDLLDIGCGGGLLSEPMARIGFTVLGVDPSEKNVKTASAHTAGTPLVRSRVFDVVIRGKREAGQGRRSVRRVKRKKRADGQPCAIGPARRAD